MAICQQCQKEFSATRFDAKFCSVNCRKRNQRKLEAIDKTYREIIRRIENLESLSAESNKDLRQKWAAQKRLKTIRDRIR